jgi:hypothetical protein
MIVLLMGFNNDTTPIGAFMPTREFTLTLPETLAKEAEAVGLLRPEALEHLLREEIRRRQVGVLFAAADRLAALAEPPLTPDEVAAEIAAARRERRAGNASDR